MPEPGYDADLFGRLAEVEPRSFWFRARNRLVVGVLERYFPGAASLLDVGCGSGFVLSAIGEEHPGMRLVGVDAFEEGLRIARERVPDAEFRRLAVDELPFDGEFDVACALDVLEHLDDDRRALAKIRDAVRPGGGIVVLVPQHAWLWSGADTSARHRRRYARRELEGRLRGAGLETVFIGSFTTSLLPAMAASRLYQRAMRRPYDLWRDLEPGVLNGVFERMLDVERRLVVGRGLSLPAGGSLLAVARRPA